LESDDFSLLEVLANGFNGLGGLGTDFS